MAKKTTAKNDAAPRKIIGRKDWDDLKARVAALEEDPTPSAGGGKDLAIALANRVVEVGKILEGGFHGPTALTVEYAWKIVSATLDTAQGE